MRRFEFDYKSNIEACRRLSLENMLKLFRWLRNRTLNSDLKTEALELGDEQALELLGISPIEVVRPKIAIRLLVLQDMEEDDRDSVGDGDYGPLFAFARGESAELRRKVGVLAVRGSPCCLTETPTHPEAAVACFSTEALSCTFMVA